MAYGAAYEYTTADTTNKNMSLFCIDVIATRIKVAAILKTQPFGFFDPENIEIDTNIKFLSPLFAKIWDIENSWRPF